MAKLPGGAIPLTEQDEVIAMMPKRALTLSIASAVLILSVSAGAAAPQDTVSARKANFKKAGGAMKALMEQLKSGTPSKPAMVAAAQTINGVARQQGALFPAGTGPGAVKTDALANIWTQRPQFDAQMAKFVAESAKLVTVANTGDTAAITAQFKATGAVCGGCHKQFRHDDD
jgi:cytochrome c556